MSVVVLIIGLEPYAFTKVQRLIHPIIVVIPALKPHAFTKVQR